MNHLKINEPKDGKCGYLAFFNNKIAEVYADTAYQARLKAVTYFKPAKSKQHMVHVQCAQP